MTNISNATTINQAATSVPKELEGYAVIHEQTVAWGEMDAFNHLNNVVFYRYAESARIAYLFRLNMFAENNMIVLAQSGCQYLLPVYFPDTLLIGVRCKKLGNTSLVFEYVFYSKEQQQKVATGEAVIVSLTADAKTKQAWTPKQKQQVLEIEATAGHVPQC